MKYRYEHMLEIVQNTCYALYTKIKIHSSL